MAALPRDARVLITFRDTVGAAQLLLVQQAGGNIETVYATGPVVTATIPFHAIDLLRKNNRVASVVEDVAVTATGKTLDTGWNVAGPSTIQEATSGYAVKVAILDTGIDLDRPDLAVAGQVTFVTGTATGDDDNGHGTSVASVVAGLGSPTGQDQRIALYAVKVLDSQGIGQASSILSGIEWAISNQMQVINMSLASYMPFPRAVADALNIAIQAGIVVVAGAGNAGNADGTGDTIAYPAKYDTVISAGAVDAQGIRVATSSTGPGLELVGTGSLTSYTAPQVARAAALAIAAGRYGIEVRQRLESTAQDLGVAGRDPQYGFGLVNAEAAAAPVVIPPEKLGSTGLAPGADTTAPVTTATLKGTAGTEGWYASDVVVSLTARDEQGGSGILYTEYSLDGARTWTAYGTPFQVAGEGLHYVLARSVDRAGNIERIAGYTLVKIDKTAPSLTITASPSKIIAQPKTTSTVGVLILGNAQDNAVGSGLASLRFTVQDQYGRIQPELTAFGSVIYIEASLQGKQKNKRVYTITATATDHAGNVSTAQTTVTIVRR